MNIEEIRKLVEIIKENDLQEFELDEENFSIRICRGLGSNGAPGNPIVYQQPAPVVNEAPTPTSVAAIAEEAGIEVIKSPMVGTFYRGASPDSPPFTSIGEKVSVDSTVCIVEAMKVMNEIQSELAGTITDILVEDGDPIEYGQPLFKVKSA